MYTCVYTYTHTLTHFICITGLGYTKSWDNGINKQEERPSWQHL